jgi:hypothetical protein
MALGDPVFRRSLGNRRLLPGDIVKIYARSVLFSLQSFTIDRLECRTLFLLTPVVSDKLRLPHLDARLIKG